MRHAIPLLLFALLLSGCGGHEVTPAASGGCAIGAYVNGMSNLQDFQTTIGKKLAVVNWYVHWTDPFPQADADTVQANGSVPMITWEPWITDSLGTLEAIASGSYESYVRGFFQSAKNWGGTIFLRFAHEMNGNWYPWDGAHNGAGAGPAKYKQAWVYIYNVKQAVGADNVKLVWCVNNTNMPDEPWNTITAYYPGDQYVDWLAMDGYNWGYDDWLSFASVFDGAYRALTALSNKPLMIGEFAAAEQGGDKAAWIADAFTRLKTDYPAVKLACWFNINKERDWRVESSAAARDAFRNALQNSYFLDRI